MYYGRTSESDKIVQIFFFYNALNNMLESIKNYNDRRIYGVRKNSFGTALIEALNQNTTRLHKIHEFK